MTDEKTRQLENRIDKLESTIEKMMPSRRDALKMGGAALVGGAAMSGTASAGTNQVGTIGSQASPVDLESEDINNADTVTTQDLVVNGTATGPFGGGAPVLEAGDSITVATINKSSTDAQFVTLFSGAAKDVLGGIINGDNNLDFLYTFSNNATLRKGGSGTNYSFSNQSGFNDSNGDIAEVDFLPPAKDVTKIDVGSNIRPSSTFGAEVILKD